MKKIVIIGANDFQNPLILKAKEMGFETHVFAWKDGSIGECTADFFYPISIVEKEEILEICKRIKPDAVVTIASDLAAITVNFLARELGLPGNSEHSCQISTNKYLMRSALADGRIPTPKYMVVSKKEDYEVEQFAYPLIVKPTDRSGSRGITKVFSKDEIPAAVEAAVENSFEKKAIIEEYIEGNEYSCECISFEGRHQLLAVTKKYTTGSPHFIETGHMEPSDLSQKQIDTVQEQIFRALDVLEIRFGASHSEFKINEAGEVRIIEIGARMGGDCIGSDLVQISTGYDFVKMTIQTALGVQPDMQMVTEPKIAAIRFLFNEEDYQYYKQMKMDYPDKIYYESSMDMQDVHDVVDSSSRYGFYIVRCESNEEAVRIAGLC